MPGHGTLIWAGDATAANREVLEAAAPEFGLSLRFCLLRELLDTARVSRGEVGGTEVGSEAGRALPLIAGLHERFPRTILLLASRDASVGFIRSALEAGASDVLSLPLQAAELQKALIRSSQAGPKTS